MFFYQAPAPAHSISLLVSGHPKEAGRIGQLGLAECEVIVHDGLCVCMLVLSKPTSLFFIVSFLSVKYFWESDIYFFILKVGRHFEPSGILGGTG